MKHGDFTELAKHYINRPGYSLDVLRTISLKVKDDLKKDNLYVADVGAGTGKLTENLAEIGFSGYAVEPNDAMRQEGMKLQLDNKFQWMKGLAEVTNLPDNCVDWVLMGSSFHWADTPIALEEFNRILRPGGSFTAIWNPRDIEKSELHQRIEGKIREIVPELTRVSSGSATNMQGMEEKMISTSFFDNLFFIEAPYSISMTKERYINVWKSVNDIQVQAGEQRFAEILDMISNEIESLDEILVPYKARAWTVKSTKR